LIFVLYFITVKLHEAYISSRRFKLAHIHCFSKNIIARVSSCGRDYTSASDICQYGGTQYFQNLQQVKKTAINRHYLGIIGYLYI